MNNQLFVKMVLDTWHSKIKEADTLFNALSDEQLEQEVAPGRNRGIYLFGHLIAVHDGMLPLLEFSPRLYPHLDEPFHLQPDRSATLAPANELRPCWKTIHETLANHFSNMQPDAWFQKHTAVSAEDFAKQPHRNKLNIIINRTNHLSYHTGQVALLKK